MLCCQLCSQQQKNVFCVSCFFYFIFFILLPREWSDQRGARSLDSEEGVGHSRNGHNTYQVNTNTKHERDAQLREGKTNKKTTKSQSLQFVFSVRPPAEVSTVPFPAAPPSVPPCLVHQQTLGSKTCARPQWRKASTSPRCEIR